MTWKRAGKPAGKRRPRRKNKLLPVRKPPARVRIDVEGCNSRITALPMKSGDYAALRAIDGGILYFTGKEIRQFKLDDKKDTLVIGGIDSGVLSADGLKILYQARNQFGIVGLGPDQKAGDGSLDLSQLSMKIEPQREWTQIFNDGWRIFRDWFYQKKLHGLDWLRLKEKYARLLPSLSHRADLDFIFGELVAEVNSGHTYVNWGDFPRVKRLDTGLLGAELKADAKAGRYMISKIYGGENWNEATRSPLTEQGVDIQVGDYLIELNGFEVDAQGQSLPLSGKHRGPQDLDQG